MAPSQTRLLQGEKHWLKIWGYKWAHGVPKAQLDPKLWFRNIHQGLMDVRGRPLKAVLSLMFSILRRIKTCPVHMCLAWGGSGKAMGCLCPKSSPNSMEDLTPKPFLFKVEAVGRGCVHGKLWVQSSTWTTKGAGWQEGDTLPQLCLEPRWLWRALPSARKPGLGPSLHQHVGLWT